MRLIKEEHVSVLHRVFGWQGSERLSVAVLAGFSLDQDRAPLDEAAIWARATQTLKGDQVLDLAMPKARGETLVLGKCFAPEGKEVQGAAAFFRVGGVEKRVEVFGDRYFDLGLVRNRRIPPEPFTEMDISWENAFGGPGEGRNPVGKGMVPKTTPDGRRLLPMPNIEDPGRLMTSPDDRPKPAGFGPLGVNWPSRIKKPGTFDKKWFVERWPGLPDDFDFEYFNLAPPDQRIQGFFKGNELILARGMHPEMHEIMSGLPEWRGRIFVNLDKGPDDGFQEVPVQLDTVCLIPHLNMGLVIWHGMVPITDDEAEDVHHILAFTESMKEAPQPEDFYRAKLEEAPWGAFPHGEPPPEDEVAPPEEKEDEEAQTAPPEADAAEEAPPGDPELEGMLAAVEKDIAEKQAQLEEHLRKHGVNPDGMIDPPHSPAPPKSEDVPLEAMLARTEAEIASLEGQLRGHLAAAGLNPDDYLGPDPKEMEPPKNPFPLEAQTAEEFVDYYRGQGVEDPELLGQLADLFKESKAVDAEVEATRAELDSLTGGDAREGDAAPSDDQPEKDAADEAGDAAPAEAEDESGAGLTREAVIAGHAQGKSFAGADLTGLDLSGCDLAGIDLKGATLEGVDLSRSNLEAAGLRQAVLTGAKLIGAKLIRADLAGAAAPESQLNGADMTEANLSEADLTEADLTGANLEQADLTRGLFSRAVMSGVKGGKAIAVEADFEDADFKGADFGAADLTRANLSGVRADNARFAQAKAREARFYGAKGEKADFEGADLSRSRVGSQASFTGCGFARTDLSHACWEDADLSAADFSETKMYKAQVNKCVLQGARLVRADAREANFSKSDLTGADMTSVNLMEGSLRKARIVQTDLRGANLYRVDLYKSTHGQTNLEGANLDGTLLGLA